MERTWEADYEKFARTARENVAATLDNMDYPALERAAELILAAKAAGKRLHISGIGKPAHFLVAFCFKYLKRFFNCLLCG